MIEILVPKENVNDETVTVLEVFMNSGANIKEGDVIVELETTKVNFEVESPCDGILSHNLSEGDDLPVGSVLFTVGKSSEKEEITGQDTIVNEANGLQSKAVISKAAREKAIELNVDLSSITSGLINVADVEKLASAQSDTEKPSLVIDELDISPKSIVIVGGGGHAKMCIDLLRQTKEYEILGIIDDKLDVGDAILGIEVIGGNSSLSKLVTRGVKYAVNGVGAISNPKLRGKIHTNLMDVGFFLPNLVHPLSNVEPSVNLGDGNQIMMGAVVGSDVQIGNGCIVNSGAIISHDCILRDHCHVAPGAILAGSIDVGNSSVIGMGATVYFGLTIGRDAMVFNGVNVLKNIPEGKIVDGN
ncbi:NeuD/PglB/VioB family sugar acetyltransferase [Pseudomonadales bacterium]|nr:NeuD/PglB/VioB family sugar acetyltransferase [Pseudomonadales bacterium]